MTHALSKGTLKCPHWYRHVSLTKMLPKSKYKTVTLQSGDIMGPKTIIIEAANNVSIVRAIL